MITKVAMSNQRPGWLMRLLGQESRLPAILPGRRVFAVGDVHGRLDLLEQLMEKIRDYAEAAAPAQNVLVLLGDYIDRGPQSKAVVDYLLGLELPSWETKFLRGNHDQALLDFLGDANIYRAWRNFGGAETLLSYGVRPPRFDDEAEFAEARDALAKICPQSHVDFFAGLRNTHEEGDYLFVHAGVRPGIPLDRQMQEDLLWIRDDFLLSTRSFGKIIVHGHTPTPSPVRRPNRLGLDTGAHATGCLTAAVLEGESCAFLATSAMRVEAVAS